MAAPRPVSSAKMRTIVSTKGVRLTGAAAPAFAPTRPADVFASLPYHGKPKTLAQIVAALRASWRKLDVHPGSRPGAGLFGTMR